MLIDQKMNDGLPVNFFNKIAMTAPAIAKFALKSLPVEGPHILVLSTWWLLLFLGKNPGFEAVEMDQTN